MSLYLRDASFVDFRTLEIRRGNIQVFEGPREGFAFVSRIPSDTWALNCRGKWVTKSFAIAHHHLCSVLARGEPPPKALPAGLSRLDALRKAAAENLDLEMIRAGALAAAAEAAKRGVTFVVDHHASPNAVTGSLAVVADALESVGLSHLLCCEISDSSGPKSYRQALQESEKHLKAHQGLVGLDTASSASDGALEEAADLARGMKAGVHAHAGEAEEDQRRCLKAHGSRAVERFAKAGLLGPKSLIAHGVYLDRGERRILEESQSWVVQCPEANSLSGSSLRPGGLDDRILLGTDGLHSDALASCRAAYLAAAGELSPLKAYRRLRRVHDYLGHNGFQGDADNNLVVLDLEAPTPVHEGNWAEHLVGSARISVDCVISSGRLIVEHGRLTRVDEDRVLAMAKEQAKRLWQRT